jgi:hypothetical protein
MSNTADAPSYWLGRAKEMREMLPSVLGEEMRGTIEVINEGYECIAERSVRKPNS